MGTLWCLQLPRLLLLLHWGPAALSLCCLLTAVLTCHRRLVSCQAEPEAVGGYTPADYITFSEDPSRQCHHNAEVLVDAPLDLCYSLWHDWTKLLDFLDLVGQVGGVIQGSSCAVCAGGS